jgi:hypothetical protein
MNKILLNPSHPANGGFLPLKPCMADRSVMIAESEFHPGIYKSNGVKNETYVLYGDAKSVEVVKAIRPKLIHFKVKFDHIEWVQ